MASYTLQLVAQPNLKNKNKKIKKLHTTLNDITTILENKTNSHKAKLTHRTEKINQKPKQNPLSVPQSHRENDRQNPPLFLPVMLLQSLAYRKDRERERERERESVCVCVCVRDFFNKERIRVVWEWKKVLFIDRKQRGNLFLSYGMPKEEEEHH